MTIHEHPHQAGEERVAYLNVLTFDEVASVAATHISFKVAGVEKFHFGHVANVTDEVLYAANGALNIMRLMDVVPASWGRPATSGRVVFQQDMVVYSTLGDETRYGNEITGAYMFEGRVGNEASILAPSGEGRWAVFSTTAAYNARDTGISRVVMQAENLFHLDLAAGAANSPTAGFAVPAMRIKYANVVQGLRGIEVYEPLLFDTTLQNTVAKTIAGQNASYLALFGGDNVANGSGGTLTLIGKSHATWPGQAWLGTPNAAGDSTITRIALTKGDAGSAPITISESLTLADAVNIAANATTGTKIGTATTQKLGFWNTAPAVQPAAVADATDAASVIARLNDLLARLRTIGVIAT